MGKANRHVTSHSASRKENRVRAKFQSTHGAKPPFTRSKTMTVKPNRNPEFQAKRDAAWQDVQASNYKVAELESALLRAKAEANDARIAYDRAKDADIENYQNSAEYPNLMQGSQLGASA